MKFCHIAPVAHLDLVKDRSAHLTLAHLIDEGHQDYIDSVSYTHLTLPTTPYV